MNRITLTEPNKRKPQARLSSYLLPLAIFAMAGGASVVAASLSVGLIEDASETAVQQELQVAGLDWAEVDAEGLNVFLIGTAPNEAARFAALSKAGTVVDAARVIDQMDVVETVALAAPRFSMEILRNNAGISLIGLVPQSTDRAALIADLEGIASETEIDDLLESARFAAPDGWDQALRYGMRALRMLPGSKISVSADGVTITARTDSPEEKARVETELSRSRPDNVSVILDISSPRPVFTPFALRFVKDGDVARFDTCSADSEIARDRILRAARAAGVTGQARCPIGLGVPTTRWAEAAELAISTVHQLGGGSVTISDADIALVAVEGTPQTRFDQLVGELENALPAVFDLNAELPVAPEANAEGPPEFIATLSPEGAVALRGRVVSEVARITADSYAKAAFGSTVVQVSARIDENLPNDWSVRVLASIEALSQLASGAVVVTPDEVTVRGRTGKANARDEITRLLVTKLGENARFTADVVYEEELDPEKAPPTPEECKAAIVNVLDGRKIRFEPGSADLDTQGRDIMDDIGEILRECGEIGLEIQGYTDSQGREVMNQQLSQSRAETIVRELRNRRVLTAGFRAVGYGEESPVADNGTEEGREANRRIEFVLIREDEEALASEGETEAESASSE
ncbi:OmpA family protein [Roseobacteraceae bacterium S113]